MFTTLRDIAGYLDKINLLLSHTDVSQYKPLTS